MLRRGTPVLLAAVLAGGLLAGGGAPVAAAPTTPWPPEPTPDPGEPAPEADSVPSDRSDSPDPTLDVHDPDCVWAIGPGDSLGEIVEQLDDDAVTVESLQLENRILNPDHIEAGALLDICVDNEIDDITGDARTAPVAVEASQAGEDDAGAAEAGGVATEHATTGVVAQQRRLNQLLGGFGMPELLVDGISGPLTRQQLCAARLLLGLPVSRADMQAGSAEEQRLLSATGLRIPPTAATHANRWVVIDMTCQVLIAGSGDHTIRFVFPASTGEPGYDTRTHAHVRAFGYNPAAHNGGWHNSSLYPVAADNPLNGNMYKPIYFDGGQAIHGANNVPSHPRSKGCVRLRVWHQDALVSWLGLGGVTRQVWDANQIGLVVTTQGRY